MSESARIALQKQLDLHERTLQKLQLSAAVYELGAVPPHLQTQMEHEEEEIERLRAKLAQLITEAEPAQMATETLPERERERRYSELSELISKGLWYTAREGLEGLEEYRDVPQKILDIERQCLDLDDLHATALEAYDGGDNIGFIQAVRSMGMNRPSTLVEKYEQVWAYVLSLEDPTILHESSLKSLHEVRSIATTADGSFAVVNSKDDVEVFNLTLGRKLSTPANGMVRLPENVRARREVALATAVEENVLFVFIADPAGTVTKWNYLTGKSQATYSPEAKDVLDYLEQRQLPKHPLPPFVKSVMITTDQTRLVASYNSGFVRVWDIKSRKPLCTVELEARWKHLFTTTQDARFLLSASRVGTIRVRELRQCHPAQGTSRTQDFPEAPSINKELRLPSEAQKPDQPSIENQSHRVSTLVMTPDHKQLVAVYDDYTLVLWDITTGRIVRTWNTDRKISTIVATPDCHEIITGMEDGSVIIWDLESGRDLGTLRIPNSKLSATFSKIRILTLTNDGQKMIACTDGDVICHWQLPPYLLSTKQ